LRPPGWRGAWSALPRAFFARGPLAVAPELLGLVLARRGADGVVRAGRIVEVEAYLGERDPASHAFRGPTPRTRVMFGPPGHLYVYRSYGMHWCANVVCDADGTAGAVLLRALEPVAGVEAMWADRPMAQRVPDRASGPGKLCGALGIDGGDDGALVARGGTHLGVVRTSAPAVEPDEIAAGPRVGISVAVDVPWRFRVRASRHVSRGEVRPRR
jgi:DNA-3-methyladenine glycosylase